MTQAANLSGTGICVAWLCYSGGTTTILASFNVASVARTATGQYTITFTNALTDSNYAAVVTGQNAPNNNTSFYVNNSITKNASGFGICQNGGGTAYDGLMYVAVFR
jgi:hypothetical protein